MKNKVRIQGSQYLVIWWYDMFPSRNHSEYRSSLQMPSSKCTAGNADNKYKYFILFWSTEVGFAVLTQVGTGMSLNCITVTQYSLESAPICSVLSFCINYSQSFRLQFQKKPVLINCWKYTISWPKRVFKTTWVLFIPLFYTSTWIRFHRSLKSLLRLVIE